MSNHDEKDLLTQALRDRSTDVGGHPIDLADVRTRARHIRRRRNAVRGAVAAMIAAVAVPSGIAVNTALDTPGSLPQQPAASTASESPAPTPRPDGAFTLTVRDLPRGEDSRLAYVVPGRKQLVTPDRTFDLPEAYSMITPYADGWLALALSRGPQGGLDVVVLDKEFNEGNRERSAGSWFELSEDKTQVAYTVIDNTGEKLLVNAPTNGLDVNTWTMPDEMLVEPVGYVSKDAIVYRTEGDTFETGLAEVGKKPAPVKGFLRIGAVSDVNGLMAGMLSYDDLTGEGCWGVTDPLAGSGDLLWDTCKYEPVDFSPDGQYVLAYPTYVDGNGPTSMYVLDAQSGDLVTEFSPETGGRTVVAVWQAAWEDSDTLLALVEEGTEMGVVRAEVNGSLEAASESFEVKNLSFPLWFAETPRS